MNAEEQAMELEALESLFPVEFAKNSSTSCTLSLVPFSDNSEENHVSIVIEFEYPASYPSESSVDWRVVKATGNVATDSSLMAELESAIAEVQAENTGCCCVYQIADKVQEWLRAHNEPERSLHDMIQSKEQPVRTSREDSDWSDSDYEEGSDYSDDSDDESYEDEEDEEYQELQLRVLCPESERVTREEFLDWKKSEYDPLLLKIGLIKRVAESDNRLTGKQQFLQSLSGRKDNKSSTNDVTVEFNEELFADEDFDDADLGDDFDLEQECDQ